VAQLRPETRGQRINVIGTLGALLSVASTTTVVVVAAADPVRGAVLGMAAAGVVALLSGLSVIGFSLRRHRQHAGSQWHRMLLGLGVTVWGAGQFLLSLQVTPSGQRAFGTGDLVSAFCMPILGLALITMPRRSRVSRPTLRLVLDSTVVTTAITVALWWVVLQPALPHPDSPGGSAVMGVLMASFDIGAAAMTGLTWARDRRRGSAAVAVGLMLQAVADISSMPAVLGNRPIPWLPGAIWCVAIPLLAVGIICYATAPVSNGAETVVEDLGESHATMISTLVSLIVLAVAMAVPAAHRWTPIGLSLSAITVVLLLGRETLNGIVRSRMVRWLSTEALRDILTGLPNRSALTAQIRALDVSRPWVLLIVDLDAFKEVNDLLGPEAGDEIIIGVGEALQRNCPPGCLVTRIDGDEFGILAAGTIEDGERLARQLSAAIRRSVGGHGGAHLSVSIGIGRVLPDHLGALLESEAALSAAKESGREQIAVYPGAVEEARLRRLLLEQRLRVAIETGALDMHAQPLVDLRTGRITGFESLARWTDEVLGGVSPAEFVPVAEQTGLITELGDFALRHTLEQARKAGVIGQDIQISVNVSATQLRNRNFAAQVIDMVAEFGLTPHQLLLEVTEAIGVDEGDPASNSLTLLSGVGIHLGIDDFGTGYSALGYLRWLPINEVKIDRSWVVASVTDRRTRDIVGGVVSLAHTLNATVVMEGIEDEVTARICRDLGADLGQGWLFGRPKPWQIATAELKAPPVARPHDAHAYLESGSKRTRIQS
jgi:diguanylate cyclase (GGDEF)-like protein